MSVEAIKQAAEKFRETVRQSTGISLDYNELSVQLLDEIIQKSFPALSPEAVDQSAQYLGAFLGEVMVRNFGMCWIQRPEDGQWVVTIKTPNGDDITSNPWNKVFKRIDNGDQDNLGYYYAMIKKAIAGELPGA